jgi:hypothetical protein
MRKQRLCALFLLPALLLPAFGAAFAQVPLGRKPQAAQPVTPVEDSSAMSGARYHSANRRDPFLNPTLFKKKMENLDEEVPRGQPPPGIAGMYISQIRLLGTVLGDDAPTAVFKGTDQRAYFLQEKDRFFDGYVQKIAAASVILVREARLRSGKTVTQEVVKQLRTP